LPDLKDLQETDSTELLKSYGIFQTVAEEEFDSIARLASYICKRPIATISFFTEDSQFVKSSIGFNREVLSLEDSICQFTSRETTYLEIKDTLEDERARFLPAVNREGGIRYYLGVPLMLHETCIGTICVMDTIAGSSDP